MVESPNNGFKRREETTVITPSHQVGKKSLLPERTHCKVKGVVIKRKPLLLIHLMIVSDHTPWNDAGCILDSHAHKDHQADRTELIYYLHSNHCTNTGCLS